MDKDKELEFARALYNNPSILVLDEATNALDTETEMKFLNFIHELKLNEKI